MGLSGEKNENHYLRGSKVVEMTSLILLCIFHATRHRKWQRLKREKIKKERKSAPGNMLKEDRINNQSREQRGSGSAL